MPNEFNNHLMPALGSPAMGTIEDAVWLRYLGGMQSGRESSAPEVPPRRLALRRKKHIPGANKKCGRAGDVRTGCV